MLDIAGRSCLVVGAGRVALAKIEGLIVAGARVTVVAPDALPRVESLASAGELALERRGYRSGEALGHMLVFAATSDPVVNRQVYDDASGAGICVNVVDVPPLCTFYMPARVRRGPLELAISTRGRAPFAASRLRRMLDAAMGEGWAEWLEAAADLRRALRAAGVSDAAQAARYDAFFEATVTPPVLGVRVPSASELAGMAADTFMHPADRAGFVSLVGAGPGDPELLTLRSLRRLRAADVVLHDALVPSAIVDLAGHAERVAVGKRAGQPSCAQAEIGRRMVEEARRGRRVVRLKSGDPFVLGRGGEEALELAAAGIAFEVVPGISTAHAAPSAAGIPVTHRGMASGFVVVSGHDPGTYEPILQDLSPGVATLVVMMGLHHVRPIAELLLERGWSGGMPSAVILGAWTPGQHVWLGDLASLADYASPSECAGLPGTIIIGQTVALGRRAGA